MKNRKKVIKNILSKTMSLVAIPFMTLFSFFTPFFAGGIQKISAANVVTSVGSAYNSSVYAAWNFPSNYKAYKGYMFYITVAGERTYCIDPLRYIGNSGSGGHASDVVSLRNALTQARGLGITQTRANAIAKDIELFFYYTSNPTSTISRYLNSAISSTGLTRNQVIDITRQYFIFDQLGTRVDGGDAIYNPSDSGLGVTFETGKDYRMTPGRYTTERGFFMFSGAKFWDEYDDPVHFAGRDTHWNEWPEPFGPIPIGTAETEVKRIVLARAKRIKPEVTQIEMPSDRIHYYVDDQQPFLPGTVKGGWIPPKLTPVNVNYRVETFHVQTWYKNLRDSIMAEVNFQKNLAVPVFNRNRLEIPVYQTGTFTRTSGSALNSYFRDNVAVPNSKPSSPNYKGHTYVWYEGGNNLRIIPTAQAPNTDYDIILRSNNVAPGQEGSIQAYTFKGQYQNQVISRGYVASLETKVTVRALKYGQINFTKRDSETGSNGHGEALMPGTKLKVELVSSDYWPAQIGYTETVTIGNDLKAKTSDKLPLGRYKVTETPGTGYLNIPDFHVDIGPNDFGPSDPVAIVSRTVNNNVIKGRVNVTKKDVETGDLLEGAVFELRRNFTNGDKTVVETITTNAQGVATTGLHPYGKYKLVEIKAPYGYTENESINGKPDSYDVFINEHNKTFVLGHENKYQYGGVTIKKQNALEPYFPWTNEEISLAGAKYDIVAVEMRLPNKTGAFKPGQVVATLTTDANGNASTGNMLQLGTYDLVEKSAPNGYEVNGRKVRFRIEYAGQKLEFSDQNFQDSENGTTLVDHYNDMMDKLYEYLAVNKANKQRPAKLDSSKIPNNFIITTNERPSLGRIEIMKTRETFEESEGGGSNVAEIEEGITFDILNHKNQVVDTMITNASGKGYSNWLPYGKYKVVQTNVTVEGDQKVDPFIVYVAQDSNGNQLDGAVHEYSLINKVTPYTLRIIKTDAETGKVIPTPGVTFSLFEEKTGGEPMEFKFIEDGKLVKRTVFATNDAGVIVFPQKIPYGTYYLQEIKAPEGYYLDPNGERVELEVIGEYTNVEFKMISKDIPNLAQKGQIELEKKGLVLKETVVNNLPQEIIDKMIEQGNYLEGSGTVVVDSKVPGQYLTTRWEDGFLEGAKYEIRAAEDIIGRDADVPVDEDGNLLPEDAEYTVHYKKGDLVETLITTRDGIVSSQLLPLGKYTLQEVEAPAGYILDETIHEFEFTPQEQHIKVTIDSAHAYNVKKEAKFTFTKAIEESEWFEHHLEAPEDIVFGLFAKEDITLTSNMTGVIPKDTFLGFSGIELNEDGLYQGSFGALLEGQYYIKELTTHEAYDLNEDSHDLTFSYDEADDPVTDIDYSQSIPNTLKRYEIELVKVSEGSGERLEGTSFVVHAINPDKDPMFVGEYRTGTDGIINIQDLEEGTYEITEIDPSAGHWTGENPTLTVFIKNGLVTIQGEDLTVIDKGDGKYQVGIEFENELATAGIAKVDSETGDYVPDASLQLLDLQENVLHEWITTGDVEILPFDLKLKVGTQYILREVNTPIGYATAEDVVFVFENKALTEVTMEDQPINVDIEKIDGTTLEPLAGATLQLLDSEGNIVLVDGEKTWVTDGTPQRFKYLPIGTYTIVEVETPEGYATSEDVIIEVLDTGEVQTFQVIDETLKVSISKIDITNSEELPGAHLEIIQRIEDEETGEVEEEVLYEWISTDEAHYIERIPLGDYILRETISPDGFILAQSEIEFTITDTGLLHTVEMTNDVTKLEISKVDQDTGEQLAGAEFELVDKETGEVVHTWESKDNAEYFEKITKGTYLLREVAAPEGYVLSDEVIEIVIDDEDIIHKVEFENKITEVKISKKDIATEEELPGAHLEVIDPETGDVIESWVSTDKPHYIKKLPVGHYWLKETIAPDGYVLSTELVEFEIDNTGVVHEVVMYNKQEVIEGSAMIDNSVVKSNGFGLLPLAGTLALTSLGVVTVKKKDEDEIVEDEVETI